MALVCEPYVGNGVKVKLTPGVQIYQFTTNTRVKACVWLKEGVGVPLGLTQYSGPNISAIELKLLQRRLILVSAYVEPDDDSSNTIAGLERLMDAMDSQHVIIGMDGNGAHPEWGCQESDARGEDLVNLAASHEMTVVNSGSTPTFQAIRHGTPCSSIVDITIASKSMISGVSSWKVDLDACPSSDHNAVSFTISTPGLQQPRLRESTYYFNNKTADWGKFRRELRKRIPESGVQVLELNSPHQIDSAVQLLTDAVRESCLKSMKLRGNRQAFNPFWTPELELQKKEVIRLHHRLNTISRRGLPASEAAAVHHAAKQAYSRAIKKESNRHFREFCQRQGPEDVWSLTNRLLKDAPANQPPSTLRIQESFSSSPEETASALLHHFYPDDTPDSQPRHRELRERESMDSEAQPEPPFTEAEIKEALNSMNPNRAPGHDNLTSDICTAVFREYAELLTEIMNACLNTHHFPAIWKDARVRMLQKPGKDDYSDLSSFRPIGLLPVFGKLLEKLMISRLTYNAQITKSWNSRQFGFRQQTSTSDALRTLVNMIKDARSSRRQVVGVSLDIKAAFDNAWWPALHERLRRTGVASNLHSLIRSYLSDRTVTLAFADSQVKKTMTKGCVQGSVCGPTFWNLILDELLDLELPEGCYLQAYADDVMLMVDARSTHEVEFKANSALTSIFEWGVAVKLRFSPAKTQAIAFTPGSRNISLRMDSQPIPFNSSIKLLGVMLDSQLNFIEHAKYIIRKVTKTFKRLCLFVRPTWGVHSENVETIYRHVIEPTITYAAGVWGEAAGRPSVRRLLTSFQRAYAIRAIRAFRTVSAVSASALAQFIPLHIKVREVHRIEEVKYSGTYDGLPDDITLEKRATPDQQLHPAERVSVEYALADNQEQADSRSSPTNIFTDGSKLDSGDTGCAFVIFHPNGRQESRKLRMDQSCSVYQAELFALHKSLTWIEKYARTDVTVYSDSRSSLQALQDRSNSHPLVVAIHDSLHRLIGRRLIRFVWIKAHVGVIGNEAADAAAKDAALQKRAKEYTAFPLSYAKHQIRQESRNAWQQEYDSATQGSGTRFFFKSLDSVRRFKEYAGVSFEATQILTGHGFHKSYLKRFHLTPEDSCPCGRDSLQDIEHILTSCPQFDAGRREYFGLCAKMELPPLELDAVCNHPLLVDSFISFITPIVNALKAFNS